MHSPGVDAGELRGVQQGQGMGLALGQRIAADHAGEARAQPQLLEQGFGEPAGLLVTIPDFRRRAAKRIEDLGHARKQPRAAAQGAAVNLQEAPQQGGELLIPASGNPLFTTRAAPWLTAQRTASKGMRRKTLLDAQRVQRGDHVGRGVEHGAVQIEQDRSQRQRHPTRSLGEVRKVIDAGVRRQPKRARQRIVGDARQVAQFQTRARVPSGRAPTGG